MSPKTNKNDIEILTLENVADVLFDAIRPLYRGMPANVDLENYTPEFRKTLEGVELYNLLCTIHNVVAAILIQVRSTNVQPCP
jgi:hypothetical protein